MRKQASFLVLSINKVDRSESNGNNEHLSALYSFLSSAFFFSVSEEGVSLIVKTLLSNRVYVYSTMYRVFLVYFKT